ncbi:hypothetical protein F5Y10DRAFT_286352, partial [Nemania abortiva]
FFCRSKTRSTALWILTLEKNLNQRLRSEIDPNKKDMMEISYTVGERLKAFASIISQIRDRLQKELTDNEKAGVPIKNIPPWSKTSEGFDFWEIASDDSSTLKGRGYTWYSGDHLAYWLPLVKASVAITLFGSGFKDLVLPHDLITGCDKCLWNFKLPRGNDLMAVTMEDLCYIQKYALPKLEWDDHKSKFESCSGSCGSGKNQVINIGMFKSLDKGDEGKTLAAQRPTGGAVILGNPHGKALISPGKDNTSESANADAASVDSAQTMPMLGISSSSRETPPTRTNNSSTTNPSLDHSTTLTEPSTASHKGPEFPPENPTTPISIPATAVLDAENGGATATNETPGGIVQNTAFRAVARCLGSKVESKAKSLLQRTVTLKGKRMKRS